MSSIERNELACRICRSVKYSDGMFLYTENLLEMYEYCFGISVTPNDTPRKLCGICLSKMKEFAKFKQQTQNSEKLWQSIINLKPISHNIINDENMYENKILKNYIGDEEYSSNSKSDDYVSIKGEIQDIEFEEIPVEQNQSIDTNDNQAENYSAILIKNENLLDRNYSSKVKKKSNSCDKCGKVFRKESTFLIHINKKCSVQENEEIIYFCGLCNMKSSFEEQVMEHLTNDHSSKNDLSCQLCDFNGRDFADMEVHRYLHQPKEYKISMKCHLCNKKSIVALALQYHYRSVHLKKKGGLCTVCGKVYNCYKMWRNHERLHRSDKNFTCDHCGRKFLFRNIIIAHLKDHSDYKGYICDICGKGFKRSTNLKLHVETVHDSNKIECGHCHKIFKNKMNLHHHMLKVARAKTFQCEVCSKCYTNQSQLRRHMIWHKDDRPFACGTCELSYKSRNQLIIHLRSHTGEMPYKCSQCSKAFPSLNQLKRHNSVHSGQRKFACSYCDRSFHYKKLLVLHCAKRHSINDFVYKPMRDIPNEPAAEK